MEPSQFKYSVLVIWLSVITLLFFQNGFADATVATLQKSGFIDSALFPNCCIPFDTVIYNGDQNESPIKTGYIEVSFPDLDIPRQSILRVYHGLSNETKRLFRDQPEYRKGMWARTFVIGPKGQNIYVEFQPEENVDYSSHVGFRMSYYNSHSETWSNHPTSELCPSISSAVQGGHVRLKANIHTRFSDQMMDCVWQIKIPPAPPQEHKKYQVYVRFGTETKTDGEMYINNGITSISPELASGIDFASLSQPKDGFVSHKGLYVAVMMPADESSLSNKVDFTYGVFYITDSAANCAFVGEAGFYCAIDHWCIPRENLCNMAHNCPSGEDEQPSNCGVVAPMIVTTTTTTTTTIRPSTTTHKVKCSILETRCTDGHCAGYDYKCDGSCKYNRKQCADGTCKFSFDRCPEDCQSWQQKCPDGRCISNYKSCSPSDCPYNEKKCRNGVCVYTSQRCAEDGCEFGKNQCRSGDSNDCYYDYDKCDGTNDCNYGEDEADCVKTQYLYLVIPAIVLVCVIFLCRYLCQKSNRSGQNINANFSSDTSNAVPPSHVSYTGTRMAPVPQTTAFSGTAMHPVGPAYQNYPNSETQPMMAPSAPDQPPPNATSAPPPSYQDVVTTNIYQAPSYPTSGSVEPPPPPSYDSTIGSTLPE